MFIHQQNMHSVFTWTFECRWLALDARDTDCGHDVAVRWSIIVQNHTQAAIASQVPHLSFKRIWLRAILKVIIYLFIIIVRA